MFAGLSIAGWWELVVQDYVVDFYWFRWERGLTRVRGGLAGLETMSQREREECGERLGWEVVAADSIAPRRGHGERMLGFERRGGLEPMSQKRDMGHPVHGGGWIWATRLKYHVSEERHREPSQSAGELLNHQPHRGHF